MRKRKTQQFTKVMNTQTSRSPHSPVCWKGWTERIFPNICYSFCRSCAWYLGCCCCLEVQEQKNTEAVKWCMSWRTSTVRELTHKTEKEISLSLSLKAMDHVAAVREKIQRCDTTKQKAAALGRAKSAPQHRSWAHLYQPRVLGGHPITGDSWGLPHHRGHSSRAPAIPVLTNGAAGEALLHPDSCTPSCCLLWNQTAELQRGAPAPRGR